MYVFVCVSVCAHNMQESDEILEINGRSTECMLHSVAICIIKHGDDNLKLVVRRAVKDGYEGGYVCAYAVHVCVCVLESVNPFCMKFKNSQV